MTPPKPFIFHLFFLTMFISCGDDGSSALKLKILERYPSPNAFAVPVDTVVSVRFDQAIKPETVDRSNFFLVLENRLIAATTSYDESTFTIILRPDRPLTFSSLYTINLTNAIQGENGGSPENLSWSFLTESLSENQSRADSLTARYRGTFNAVWSAETHPLDYPDNSHFSGIIGVTHKDSLDFFKVGKLATDGIKNMAELGAKTELINEFEELIASGAVQIIISGGGIGSSPGSVSFEFEIKSSHSRITIFSMIAPSPDWFIAIQSINLNSGGFWQPTKTVPVDAFDAGTDSGTTYAAANQTTEPPETMQLINTPPLAKNGSVPSLGSITFERIN